MKKISQKHQKENSPKPSYDKPRSFTPSFKNQTLRSNQYDERSYGYNKIDGEWDDYLGMIFRRF